MVSARGMCCHVLTSTAPAGTAVTKEGAENLVVACAACGLEELKLEGACVRGPSAPCVRPLLLGRARAPDIGGGGCGRSEPHAA